MPCCCKTWYFLFWLCSPASVDDNDLLSSQDRQEQVVASRVVSQVQQQDQWPFTEYRVNGVLSDYSYEPTQAMKKRQSMVIVKIWLSEVDHVGRIDLSLRPDKPEHKS